MTDDLKSSNKSYLPQIRKCRELVKTKEAILRKQYKTIYCVCFPVLDLLLFYTPTISKIFFCNIFQKKSSPFPEFFFKFLIPF